MTRSVAGDSSEGAPRARGLRRLAVLPVLFMLLGLACLAVLDCSLDKQREQLSQRISAERNSIEPLTSLRRDTRKTYVTLLERWLAPPQDRPKFEKGLQEQTAALLRSSQDFLQGTALTPAGRQHRAALAADITAWIAFIDQILGSAAGQEMAPEAREHLDTIDRHCSAVLTVTVDGANQDAAWESLNQKDNWSHVAIVALLALLLAYLLVWYLRKLAARKVAEVHRRQQQQEEQGQMLEHMVRERTAELVAANHELSQSALQLHESERRFQTTFEQAAIGMAIVGPDGKMLQVNRRLCEIIGYTADELLTLRFQDITHPDDLPADLVAIRALRSGEMASHSRCKRYVRKDGDIVWIKLAVATVRDESGKKLDYFVLAFEDITEARRAEKALQESEEKFRRLFDSAHDALMTLEPPFWRFTDGNPATLAMFKAKSVADFTSHGPDDLSPEKQPDGRASGDVAPEMIGKAMREGSACFEWMHKRIDGQEFPTTVLLTRMEQGGRPFLQATVRDISKEKQLELELGHAHKLEAVGQLAAGIAHEINTPAQFVGDGVHFLREAFAGYQRLVGQYRRAVEILETAGAQQALISEIRETEEEIDLAYLEANVPGSFESCQDGINRITTIVRAMKDFAHPDQREKASADLNQALRTTLAVAKNEYKYVADVTTELGDLPPVLCHVGDLNQVFLNLIVNAAHAIGDVVGQGGGKGTIRIKTLREGDQVRIDIADTGAGIPEAIRPRIFDPFFTTKEVGKGTGQGLSIARSIVVTKHRGSLTFESEVGKGTTFTIQLPIGGERDSA
jgi:PAS domain S-box-containing protein